MILVSLFTILLTVSCGKKPVTLVNFDVKNNTGHVEKIIEVDQKTCKFKSETQPKIPLQTEDGLINKIFDEGIWISKADYFAMYEAWLKDCKKKAE